MGRPRSAAAVLAAVALLGTVACEAPVGRGDTSVPPAATGSGTEPPESVLPGAGGPAASPAPPTAMSSVAPDETLPTSASWARVTASGEAPGPREDHTWTVDGDGKLAYLFGGRDGGKAYGDLWAFDLATATWSKAPVTSGTTPDARFGHEAQWVPGLGLVIFAGQAGSTFFDDLWLYDPVASSWTALPADGSPPIARYGSCSGIGPDGRLWISHGFTSDGARFADTSAYDFGLREWASASPSEAGPVERCLHSCWWTSGGELVLYGGQTTGVAALGDLWRLTPGEGGGSTNSWTEAPDPGPAARHLPAVARRGDVTLVVGGRGIDRKPLADAWLLQDGADGFEELSLDQGDAPGARSGAALIHDAGRDRFLLFGGIGSDAFDDLWALTLP